jgi:diguanylate cyclase (GGDEF)-like protein
MITEDPPPLMEAEMSLRADILYRSERTIVSRVVDPVTGTAEIRKFCLGPDAAARCRHEARMLERLAGIPGVSQLVSVGTRPVLVLRDFGGAPLAGHAPLAASVVLDLALSLARTLAEIHRRGVLHLDIAPANILYKPAGQAPQFIDFHLATLAEEGRRSFTHHNEIAGTLAYIAPELTGRLGQAVDQRADLYALGATLYELATGQAPFGQGDPLRLLRDVVATIPAPPQRLAPALPTLFSDIILRLLEKEPDRRYQSADGLADDLERLRGAIQRGENASFPLGASDFPLRLLPPSRLTAREAEIKALRSAFTASLAGSCNLLLISGPSGVGKTALIQQFRPIVTARNGWFVAGHFERNRNNATTDPLLQVTRRLVALLLAEPDAEIGVMREALAAKLGEDLAQLVTAIPQIGALFGAARPAATPAETGAEQASAAFLRGIVSAARPLVMVFDNLQWATTSALRRIESLLASDPVPGFLVVGAYRDDKTDDPFAARLSRWQRLAASPREIKLRNLPPAGLTALVGDMLRLAPGAAKQLAKAVGPRTGGNPADTLELLNGLRRDQTLTRGATGWRWDSSEIRRHIGDGDVADRLAARIAALAPATRDMLADMACFGNSVTAAQLATATGISEDDLDVLLSPALADGLLVLEQEADRTRSSFAFRNEAVARAVHDRMDLPGQPAAAERHLTLARRLAITPGQDVAAAEQYLAAFAAIKSEGEAMEAIGRFTAAARAAARGFRFDEAEAYFAAAIRLTESQPIPDRASLTMLRTGRLTALYSLGRHDDADRLFQVITDQEQDPVALIEATCVQVLSLSNRGRHGPAVATGLPVLQRLGIQPPSAGLDAFVAQGLLSMPAWLAADAALSEAERRVTQDPIIRGAARLINRLLPSAQLLDPLIGAWLAVASQCLWVDYGVCPEVVASLARSAAAPNVFGADYRTGYDMARHAIAVGTAFGFEAETAFARQNFVTFSLHWFERLEAAPPHVAAASAALIAAGEVQAACINYIASLAGLFDSAPTLDVYGTELARARDFTARTGNDAIFESFHSHTALLQTLTGAADARAILNDVPSPAIADKPLASFGFHCTRAIIAALFDDAGGLAQFSAAAMPFLDRIGGAYRCAIASMLHAVSLAIQARATETALPPAFHTLRDWFAARARDAPPNFAHLLHLIDAQGAWTRGETEAAIAAFDRALQFCGQQTRPWHHAYIAEQAGLFHLAYGFDYLGRALLTDARNRYADWGAPAVVRRLAATHGFLDAADDRQPLRLRNTTTTKLNADAVDLMAILRTSQALSSQTNLSALRALVVQTLAELTGATAVTLVIWDDQLQTWCLPPEDDRIASPVGATLPLSALRYVERTSEPLVVDDARLDDRFARDPYFVDVPRCSLLVMPVRSQGQARALLVLENRLKSGVFSQSRLNLLTLIAGQLAVSLDNALLYASLERRVAERTEALAEANRQLEVLSISDSLTGLANRRRFDTMLEREWRRAARDGTSLGLVMIDVDHFKRFNDRYGHLRGDHCLRAVAQALQASVRQDVDLVARYGGEEFAMILPGADASFAEAIAARGLAAIIGLQQPHATSPFGQVTISLGVAAMLPDQAGGAERLIEAADAALYRAKQTGRNQVAA